LVRFQSFAMPASAYASALSWPLSAGGMAACMAASALRHSGQDAACVSTAAFVSPLHMPSQYDGKLYVSLVSSLMRHAGEQRRGYIRSHELQATDVSPAVKAIYYGTEKNHTLIWEEGMTLPPAGEDMEQDFKYLEPYYKAQ